MIAPFQSESVSGHSQIDGPTEVADLHATQDNKAVVRSFVDEVLIKDEWDDLSLYISSTTFTQHNPDIPDGLEGLKAYRAQLAAEGKAVQYQSLFKLIGQGNFVATYGKTIHGKDSLAVFDLYRLENGLIVEHWDNKEVILPASQWGNSGKF